MFDAIVIAYDDYMESIDLVMEETEEFERALTAYRADLVRGLSRLNNDVSASFAGKNFSILKSRLQTAQNNYETAKRLVNSAWEAVQVARDTPNYDAAYERYRNALDQEEKVSEQCRELEAEESSDDYKIFLAIQELNNYYSDPLYLCRKVEGDSTKPAKSCQDLKA